MALMSRDVIDLKDFLSSVPWFPCWGTLRGQNDSLRYNSRTSLKIGMVTGEHTELQPATKVSTYLGISSARKTICLRVFTEPQKTISHDTGQFDDSCALQSNTSRCSSVKECMSISAGPGVVDVSREIKVMAFPKDVAFESQKEIYSKSLRHPLRHQSLLVLVHGSVLSL